MKKILSLFLLLTPLIALSQDKSITYPTAKQDSVADIYFGKKVADPYRWLEDDQNAETQNWIEQQTDVSDKYLLKQDSKYLLEKQLKLNSYVNLPTLYKSGNYYFSLVRNSFTEPAKLQVQRRRHDVTSDAVDPENYKTDRDDVLYITGFEVSEDNEYFAFGISHGGSDWMEIRVKSMYPFRDQDDILHWVKNGHVKWKGNGFYYTRYPEQKEKYLTGISLNPALYYHKLGTKQENDILIYKEAAYGQSIITFDVIGNGQYLVVNSMQVGSPNAETKIFFSRLQQPVASKLDTLLVTKKQYSFDVVGLLNNKIVVNTTMDAPHGRLLTFDMQQPNMADELVHEYKDILLDAAIIGNKLVCKYLKDIDYSIAIFDTNAAVLNLIQFPAGTSLGGLETGWTDSTTRFYYYSFLHPPIVYDLNVNSFQLELVDKTEIAYEVSDFAMKKVYYPSKDGDTIPMILAYKKKIKKNWNSPVLLYGYGGYGTIMTPFYNRGFMTFIQNGGILALPCLRGGGELGAEWHYKGSRFNKQNVFDDFIAAAEYMKAEGYTTKEKLAIMGGSNGGLLVAAVINQKPDLCAVAIAEKGVYDMLRYQYFTRGNLWEDEYGSSKDSLQFEYLKNYSPLHKIKDTNYPAVLVVTADHDDRVVPAHSYKYAAALQNNKTGNTPKLLHIEKNSGHQTSRLITDRYIYSFIYTAMQIAPKDVDNYYY